MADDPARLRVECPTCEADIGDDPDCRQQKVMVDALYCTHCGSDPARPLKLLRNAARALAAAVPSDPNDIHEIEMNVAQGAPLPWAEELARVKELLG